MSIIKKAEELGKEIVDSAEYKELKSTEEAMQNDKEAQSLLNEFRSKQQRLQMAQANGKNITEDQKKELMALQARMQENEKIKNFMTAQQKFNQVMQTVNQAITGIIAGQHA
ncbi:YlbF family regulator [Halothermothrix orenii]|uniref:Uncharacterized conserved protein n=1 Tax=Halothermothrix orenii (strain H 168 / OCM 544 / DSM 9562) TaxID=373903 RepID=B8CYA7_HALOH|nr:YlbF family regulator [Halothermothrix orenii]ACL70276.1 uncharacterized conserved protein [Halothermothrix orenii H 168]